MKTTLPKPIPFTPEMVQAILAGRKSQTRRIISPEVPEGFKLSGYYSSTGWPLHASFVARPLSSFLLSLFMSPSAANGAKYRLAIAKANSISTWNDDRNRTHAEVLAAFDKAIEGERVKEP